MSGGLVIDQAAFLLDATKLIAKATLLGFTVTAGELYRTIEQQEIYFKTGRSKTMNSMHLKRLAIDLNFFKDGSLVYDRATLRPLGEYWEGLSPLNRWGGNFDRDWSKADSFVDVPHFERQPQASPRLV